jgi:hypothetical protein
MFFALVVAALGSPRGPTVDVRQLSGSRSHTSDNASQGALRCVLLLRRMLRAGCFFHKVFSGPSATKDSENTTATRLQQATEMTTSLFTAHKSPYANKNCYESPMHPPAGAGTMRPQPSQRPRHRYWLLLLSRQPVRVPLDPRRRWGPGSENTSPLSPPGRNPRPLVGRQ